MKKHKSVELFIISEKCLLIIQFPNGSGVVDSDGLPLWAFDVLRKSRTEFLF